MKSTEFHAYQFAVSIRSLHIRGVWVFTHESFMLSSLLGLRRPFLCSWVFCSIFPFHFWLHKGMLIKFGVKKLSSFKGGDAIWICSSSLAYSRLHARQQILLIGSQEAEYLVVEAQLLSISKELRHSVRVETWDWFTKSTKGGTVLISRKWIGVF